jgi:hypothetical protein
MEPIRIKQTFEIEYDAPYPNSIKDSKNWLCAANVQLLLNQMKRFATDPNYKVKLVE